ncbi:FtsX-like permease family protein [Thermotoga sp. KOL6]|uniref:ABC transporter permease n=1 Tax=Thermotoga sp. KOL6 TaxID=126741 RepID=UPI000C75CD39|nr:ABC transporter permease [Thermotoga sp. KOL6]PLV59406.1 multidrug ABC transporter substrate-binding protein [Thermotoga sp. KOL6]
MVLKIAWRNFTKNLRISFVVILGLAISLSLVTGAFSLSDSINAWKWERIRKNFGKVDAVAEPKNPSFFLFSFTASKIEDSEIEKLKEQVKKVLPVLETTARLNDALDVLVIATNPDELSDFVEEKIRLEPGEAIVGEAIANALNLKLGNKITLLFPSGKKVFTVKMIGESGFLNFKGETASMPGSVFIHVSDSPSRNFPSKCYLHYGLPLEKHAEVSLSTGLRVRNIKYDFLKSPVNRSLTYVTLAFSGISIFVGFLVFYMFCEDVIRDRNFTLVTLRKIGIQKRKEWGLLLLEGFMYSLISASIGTTLGVFVGKFLLNRFQTVVETLSSTFLSIDKVSFHLSLRTIFLSLGLGIIFPMILFSLKAREVTSKPPVYRELEEKTSLSSKSFILMLSVGMFLFFFSNFRLLSLALISLALVVKFKNAFLLLGFGTLNLLLGILTKITLESESAFLLSALNKGLTIFLGITLLTFSIVLFSRKILEHLVSNGNLPLLIGFSYVQRFPKKGITIALTFAFLIFSVTIFDILSASADLFVEKKIKSGLFGYNFLVLENPFKSFLGNVSIPVHEELKDPSMAYLYLFKTNFGEKTIAFVDEQFLKGSNLKLSAGTAKSLRSPNAVLVGDEISETVIKGTLKSLLPLGGRKEETFKIVGKYNKNDYLVPVDMISLSKNKPNSVKPIMVLLGKVIKDNSLEIKKFYLSKFSYPFFLDEELAKLYSGIEGLVDVIKFIFFFGFLSAISGLILFVLKSYLSRVRIMGTLRAVGMKASQLMMSFLIEHLSFLIGGIIVGTISGSLMGVSVAETMSENLGTFIVSVPIDSILLFLLIILTIAVSVMTIPIYLISKLSPLEAMKEGSDVG